MATEALSEIVENVGIGAYAALLAGTVGLVSLQAANFRSNRLVKLTNSFSQAHVDQVGEFADATVRYVRDQNIGAIALLDGAARPFYKPLIESWRSQYNHATDPRPPIFFLNPQGFQEASTLSINALLGPIVKPVIKGGPVGMPWKRRSREAIVGGFVQEHPWLYELRDQPLLVIDSCIHSGSSAAPVLAGLKGAGFNDIRLQVISSSRKLTVHSVCDADIILSEQRPLGGCYPFGVDTMTEKTHGSTISQATTSLKRRRMARQLRRNLEAYFGSSSNP